MLNPFSILFYGLALGALGCLFVLARGAADRASRTFGLASLGLIGSLDVMSILGGFSVGPIMIGVAVLLAILLTWGSPTFRMPLGLMSLATILLAVGLWLGGTFQTVQWSLGFGLAAVAILAVMRLAALWADRQSGEFGGWCLALSAALGGIGLIFGIPDPTGLGLWAARLGALAAAGLVFFSPRYQLGLVAAALVNGLLAIGLGGI